MIKQLLTVIEYMVIAITIMIIIIMIHFHWG